MGLEAVELVMDLEDEFAISIPDAIAEKIISVGQTSKYIAETLTMQKRLSDGCASAHSFYALRRQLVDRFEVERSAVRPDALIGKLVPRRRGKDWQEISDASGLRREPSSIFRKRNPPAKSSVRELIESRCLGRWQRADGTVDEELVFQTVRRVVSKGLDVPAESISRETQYVKDLHI